jgi:predicted alpha/beta superfamily hydrolase
MAGSSLGGLISAYAGLHDSETFGRVACVSPSLWWDDQHLLREVESLGRPGVTRWYQDMGTLEQGRLVDLDQNRVDDAVDGLRRLRDLLKRQGMREGVDLMSVEGEGQRHHESAWAQRLPALLEFLAAP